MNLDEINSALSNSDLPIADRQRLEAERYRLIAGRATAFPLHHRVQQDSSYKSTRDSLRLREIDLSIAAAIEEFEAIERKLSAGDKSLEGRKKSLIYTLGELNEKKEEIFRRHVVTQEDSRSYCTTLRKTIMKQAI
jgi:hypothetical protein